MIDKIFRSFKGTNSCGNKTKLWKHKIHSIKKIILAFVAKNILIIIYCFQNLVLRFITIIIFCRMDLVKPNIQTTLATEITLAETIIKKIIPIC